MAVLVDSILNKAPCFLWTWEMAPSKNRTSPDCFATRSIPGIHNPADLLTKAKFGAEFRHLWNLLMKPGDHGREPVATTSSNTEPTTT